MTQIEQMLNELEANQLQVQLTPSKRSDRREHDMIRVVVDYPPKWYRALCNRHVSSREVRRGKFDTKIKRANVLSVLRVLVKRGTSTSKYADEILAIARQREKKSA